MGNLKLVVQMLIVAIIFAVVLGAIFVIPSDPVESAAFESESESLSPPAEIDHDETTAVAGYDRAVRLSGGDDRIEISDVALGDGTWTFCNWVRASDTDESRMIAGDGEISIFYNATSDEFGVWMYNESSRNSYVATVEADDATSWQLVCGSHDGDENNLTVSRNTTISDPVSTEGESQADMPASAHWDGTIDDSRLYFDSLTLSDRLEIVTDPTLSIDDEIPDLRIRYERIDGDEAPVYFHDDATAELHGTTETDGLAAPTIVESEDYNLSSDSSEISIEDGGQLTTGDVVFVEFDVRSSTARSIAQLALGIGLLAILAIPLLRYLGDE